MYFHNVVGTGSDTTSTTNMYHKDFTYQGAQFGLALGARVTGVAHAGGNAFGVSGGPMVGGSQEGQWKDAGRCGWVGIGHF